MMKLILTAYLAGIFMLQTTRAQVVSDARAIDTSTVIGKLHVPWEILWGPDNHIWFTERDGKVRRLNPVTKTAKIILKMTDVVQQSESGLLGMALHPNFKDSAFVYLVYNYLSGSTIKERLVRYTYTSSPDTLKGRVVLLDNVAGNGNHNGSRLLITADRKILMTTGDAQNTSLSQNNSSISGKLLRLNLDGSVPADNPVKGNLQWSKGHRNAQGLAFGPNGLLYSSEHGPNNDDEMNIIKKGRNYGWPTVEGPCNSATETQFCKDSSVVEPIKAWTPTLAVAGIDYYNSSAIPEWTHSILLTNLKESDFRVLKLDANGETIIKETTYFNNWFGRLRDVCVAPNGDVYISTSNRDGRANSPFPRPIDDRIIKISGDPVGMNQTAPEAATVKIRPNPFTDQTSILIHQEGAGSNQEYECKLYNLLGETVKRLTLKNRQEITFSRGDLPKGIYIFQLIGQGRVLNSSKLIIN